MKKIFTIYLLLSLLSLSSKVYSLTYIGDLTLNNQTQVDAFNYDVVTGTLTINGSGITNINALRSLDTVGNLYIQNTNIVNVNGLNNLKAISGVGSGILHSDLYFQNNPLLSDLAGFTNTKFIGNMVLVFYGCSALTSLNGIQDLDWTTVNKDVGIRDCNSLTSLTGLVLPASFPFDNKISSLSILNNSKLKDVSALAGFSIAQLTITGDSSLQRIDLSSAPDWRVYSSVSISNNQSLRNIKFAKNTATTLYIQSNSLLDSISGMKQIISTSNSTDFIFGDIVIGGSRQLKHVDLFNFPYSCKGGRTNEIAIYGCGILNLDFLNKFTYFGRVTIEANGFLNNCCGIYNLIKDRPFSDSIGIYANPFACRNVGDILTSCGDTSNLTYNLIHGRIYSDLNANNEPDVADIFLDNIKIQATKNGNTFTHLSLDSGRYYFVNDTGTYTIQLISNFANFATVPASQTITHNSYGNRDTINFKLASSTLVNDASVILSNNWLTRPNRQGTYTISYTNESGQNYNGTVKLKLDSRLTYQSATPSPTSIVGDTMIWNITNLPLFTTKNITINFLASASLVANDTLKTFVKIYNNTTDTTPNNNQFTLNDIVRASYDPNNKEVNKTILTPTEVAQSPYLYYTIHFQNIGNDTAFDIAIKDTLDANLDGLSFQPITASHKYNLDQKNNQFILFDFKNIKLVDSTHNERLSHGFIAYKIKTRNSLAVGNSIKNKAAITFDVNTPITTNTVITIVQLATALKNNPSIFDNIYIYPNPTNSYINIDLRAMKHATLNLVLTTIDGRVITQKEYKNINTISDKLDINQQASGMYFLQINTENEQATYKIMKQ
jgi:uncharacterized repeat protein (TIGR01451 family)